MDENAGTEDLNKGNVNKEIKKLKKIPCYMALKMFLVHKHCTLVGNFISHGGTFSSSKITVYTRVDQVNRYIIDNENKVSLVRSYREATGQCLNEPHKPPHKDREKI